MTAGWGFVGPMAFETTVTLPTPHLPDFMLRMTKAGFLVLDTGERVATESGPDAEATVRLLHLAQVEVSDDVPCVLGVSA